ncbi:MAG: type II toxin-antitoxin system VapC family toxin [Acaryochloris sp. RU_4_1]|nr:type II toxin-antitoxin system VapC family toxin [Acaryochloris sp. RU_4_1]NJR56504.1 type II toxin-antitoxin system VapC family toxin [Acaryochloris sp. CRU_2_0]
MNLLLDTHTTLWYLQDSPNLSSSMGEILEETEHKLYLSIASLWEIAIKCGLGKLDLDYSFQDFPDLLMHFDIKILPITFEDTRCYLTLPLHHRDPFDRMLIAQAIHRSYLLVSQDVMLDAYPIQRLWK